MRTPDTYEVSPSPDLGEPVFGRRNRLNDAFLNFQESVKVESRLNLSKADLLDEIAIVQFEAFQRKQQDTLKNDSQKPTNREQDALATIYIATLPLIVDAVKKHAPKGAPKEEFVGLALETIQRCAYHFNPNYVSKKTGRKVSFNAYVAESLHWELAEDKTGEKINFTFALPEDLVEYRNIFDRVEYTFMQQEKRQPRRAEIIDIVFETMNPGKRSKEILTQLYSLFYETEYIPAGGDDQAEDMIPDLLSSGDQDPPEELVVDGDDLVNPEIIFSNKELRSDVLKLLNFFKPRDRYIVTEYLNGERNIDIGQSLGISRERVRKIKEGELERLRKYYTSQIVEMVGFPPKQPPELRDQIRSARAKITSKPSR